MRTKILFQFIVLTVLVLSDLSAGFVSKNFRPFTLRNTNGTSGDNIYGDFNVTGAPIMCAKNSGNNNCDWGYSGYLFDATGKMLTDANPNMTLNSSSADLTIPTDATITKAYLYWSGHIYGNTNTQAAFDAATAGFNNVTFQTPDGINHDVSVDANDISKVNYYSYISDQGAKGFRLFYQATADVTDLVKNGGYNGTNKKTFIVGNLKVTDGKDFSIYEPELSSNVYYGPMGGWSLIVEYNRPIASGQKYKNVSIYDGFDFLLPPTNQDKQIDISISGFLTPLSGTPAGSMAFYTMGSERKLKVGEKVQIANKSGTLNNLFNSANAVGEQLNDTMTIDGTQITAGRDFNPGIDLDVFNIATSCKTAGGATVACIDVNQTSTTIRLGVHNNNNTSDQSFPGMIAFSVDIYQPDISVFRKDSNTSATQKLNPEDSIQYTLDFNNTGTEAAENITIYDTFSSTVGGDMLLDIIDRNSTALKNGIRLKSAGEANYHCAVGSTDPGCASLSKDANCSVDYADGNVSKATKVWCNIPFMAVNDRYLMQFSIKIRDDYNQSSAEANVTNIAYSDYYNAATHEHIILMGQSNINTAGVVGGYIPIPASGFDAREISIAEADNDRSITTKIVNKPFQLNVVSLDTSGAIAPYTVATGNRVYLFPVNSSVCSLSNSEKLTTIEPLPRTAYADFSNGDTTKPSPAINLSNALLNSAAGKDNRIVLNYVDWGTSFQAANFSCSNSNTQAVLLGVPQCLNADHKIGDVFGQVTQDVCAGGAAHGMNPALANPPCQSNSYNAGNLPSAPFDNSYGCYQCIAGMAGIATCSTDNFAARPDRFEFTVAGLMKSGEDYTITTYAKNYSSTDNTADYNQTVSNLTGGPTSWWNRDTAAQIMTVNTQGTITIAGAGAFNNGVGSVPIRFSDVGKFTLDLNDSNWAAVDVDDTPLSDRTIHGDGNVTFIPYDFNISVGAIVNNNGVSPSFTYLSNDLNMSARIPMTVSAQNKQGATTLNYANNMFERPITIIPYVSSTTATARGLVPVTLGATNADANFVSGSKSIIYNDPLVARFNFSRDPKVVVFPFDVNSSNGVGSDVNVSIIDTDSVYGDRNQTLDQNATFVYGRLIPRDVRVFGPVSFTANAWYEVYNTTSISGVPLAPSRFESMWYINILHTDVVDGNGTVSQVPGGSLPNLTTYTNGVKTYNFNASATIPFSAKAHIDADSWLWYGEHASAYADPSAANLDCLTHPCFNINVVPAVGATGSAKTSVQNNKASKASTSGGGAGWKSTNDYSPAIR